MKKVLMTLAAVALVAFFSSCNKEDDVQPMSFQKKLAEVHKYVYSNESGEWEFVENEKNEYFEWDGDRLVKWHNSNFPNVMTDSFAYDNAGRLITSFVKDSVTGEESFASYEYEDERIAKILLYTLDSVLEAEYDITYVDGKLSNIFVTYFDASLAKSSSPIMVRQRNMLNRTYPEASQLVKAAQQTKGVTLSYNTHYMWGEDGSSTACFELFGIRDTLTLTYGNMPNPYFGFYDFNYIDETFILMSFPMFAPTLPITFCERGGLGNADGEFLYEFDGDYVTQCTYYTPAQSRSDDGTYNYFIERKVTTYKYTVMPISE